MHAGPSNRSRHKQRAYNDHRMETGGVCEFCEFSPKTPHYIESNKYFWVVENLWGYDIWDDMHVDNHLMIVPKRHIVGLHEFHKQEVELFFKLVRKYEKKGYSLYARAPSDPQKSVIHQHTHLIRLGETRTKFKLHIRRPHVLIYK